MGGSDIELLIAVALVASWVVVFGWLGDRLASQRDRSRVRWIVLGAIFGPAALIVLQEGPPGHCASCRAPVTAMGKTCQWCGNDVRTGMRDPRAAPAPASSTQVAQGTSSASVVPTVVALPVVAPPVPANGGQNRDSAGSVTVAVAVPSGPVQPVGTAGAAVQERLMVSGVFVTGSVGLSVGSRYSVQILGPRLRVLGPHDRDPSLLALERDLIGMDATGHDGRLIINQVHRGRADLVLVFMSLSGRTTDSAATEIVQAVRAAEAVRA